MARNGCALTSQARGHVSSAVVAGRLVKRLIGLQAVSAIALALVVWLFSGLESALAIAAGAGIGLVLTLFVAVRALAFSADVDPQRAARAFSRAMSLKLVLAAVLFALSAHYFSDWFGPILLGYISTVPAYWIVGLTMTETASQPARENGEQQ